MLGIPDLFKHPNADRALRAFPLNYQISPQTMPTISSFYGITIRMYFDEHGPPHFHAIYKGDQAVIDIESLRLIAGRLPPRALRLVRVWAKLRRHELRVNWGRIEHAEPLADIEPLE